MFAQFNFGDPSEYVRDAIGDYLEARLDEIPGIEVVGRLTGWGSWVDDATGERYLEQSGSVQVILPPGATVREAVEAFASAAANKFDQDAVAVLYG